MSQNDKLPPLPKVGAICYASAQDVLEYKPAPEVGKHLPGVRDVALWSTHQMQAATERATAIERGRCAAAIKREAEKTVSMAKFCGLGIADLRPYDICEAAIRQGGAA